MKYEPKTKKGPVVHLFDLAGTALIIEWPSGVRYSNQTMGTACAHPEVEGILLPLGNDVKNPDGSYRTEKKLHDYFVGEPYRGSGAQRGLSEADAEKIDSILRAEACFDGILVNRYKLQASHEAWVHVTIQKSKSPYPLLRNVERYPLYAVLTWANSD
jgi:hypothetical protein